MYPKMTDDGYFIVTAIHRNDVASLIGEKNAEKLTDGDMCQIARYMTDGYLESGLYWDQLKMLSTEILEDEFEEWDSEEDEEMADSEIKNDGTDTHGNNQV